jgi:hypothetical protein
LHEPKASPVAVVETVLARCDDCFEARVIVIGGNMRRVLSDVGFGRTPDPQGQQKDPPQAAFLELPYDQVARFARPPKKESSVHQQRWPQVWFERSYEASQPAASAVMHDWTERHPNRIYGTRRSHARWQRAANCASCVLTTVHHSCRVSSWLQSSWRPVVRARRQGQLGLFSWYVIGGLLDA